MKILKTIKEWCEEHEVEIYDETEAMIDENKIDLQEFSRVTAKHTTTWRNPHKNGFTMMSCGLISGVWVDDS